MSATLKSRITDAAVVLQPYLKDKASFWITAALEDIGVDKSELGFKILEADSTTVADFILALRSLTEGSKEKVTDCLAVPEPRARAAWLILKGCDPFKQKELSISDCTASTTAIGIDGKMSLSHIAAASLMEQLKPIGQWSDGDLLKSYSKNCPMSIEEELLKRSRGRPTIIFNDDGTVEVDSSITLLRQARHCSTPSTFIVNGKLRQVYKIGDFPMDVVYECPVHSGILLLNGYCEECGLEWANVESNKDKYAFLRLVAERMKIEPVALRMYMQHSFDELTKLFPKILLVYNELKEEDRLPTLKRRMSKNKEGDPFRVVHTTY
jgi:hypothetical protein